MAPATAKPPTPKPPTSKSPERLRRGLTLEQRRSARREALIDAAIELFGTEGYADTAVKDVCRLAYVSSRDYYDLFDNREDLLVAVGERVQATVFAAFADAYEASDRRRTLDRVIDGMAATVRVLTDDPRIGRIAYVETLAVDGVREVRRAPAIREFAASLTDLLAEDFARAGMDRAHAEAVCMAMIGGANELVSDYVMGDRADTPDEVAALIADTLRAMFPRPKRATSG